jgi:hypothetical protein
VGHELEGVQSKIDRALEHIKSLQDKSASFLEGQPYDIAQKPQADGWERAIFHVQREPPLELGVIAGDFAHNLRSGLDHLIYQLAVLDTGGDPPNRTGFPIFEDEGAYRRPGRINRPSYRDLLLAGINEAHRALVDAEQPYADRVLSDSSTHPLAALRRFSNTDKHRLIHTAIGRPTQVRATPVGGTCRVELRIPPDPPPLVDGAHIYDIRVTEASEPEVKVQIEMDFMITFGDRRLTDGDMLSIHAWVVGLVDRFRPVFS